MGKTFWDRFAFAYDTFEGLNKRTYNAMITKTVTLVPDGGRVLECAAGTGAISLAAAKKAGEVVCTDRSLPMLAVARRKAEKRGLANIRFAQRDVFAMQDEDAPFDVVIAANVIHLLDEPALALQALWQAVRAGGVLVVPTFLTAEAGPGFRFLICLYQLLGFSPQKAFTVAAYAELLNDSGLPPAQLAVLPGRVPVGFAVFHKPV